ncbi:hypothetical protein KW790_01465 [Candidatus Parcubacteria bacterium]|nr:hypothetical protein [Candidatus Parcubacteria bacterium]
MRLKSACLLISLFSHAGCVTPSLLVHNTCRGVELQVHDVYGKELTRRLGYNQSDVAVLTLTPSDSSYKVSVAGTLYKPGTDTVLAAPIKIVQLDQLARVGKSQDEWFVTAISADPSITCVAPSTK